MAMICCSVTAKSKGTGQWALDNGHWWKKDTGGTMVLVPERCPVQIFVHLYDERI